MPSSRSRTRNTSVGWSHKAPACAAASHPAAAAPHISRLLGYNNDRWQGENVCFWTLLTNPETVVTKLRWEKLDTTNPPSSHHYQLSRPLHHIPLKQTKNRKTPRLKFHCHSKIQIRSTKNELEYIIKKKIWHTFKLVKCQNALKFHCNSRKHAPSKIYESQYTEYHQEKNLIDLQSWWNASGKTSISTHWWYHFDFNYQIAVINCLGLTNNIDTHV